MKPFSTHRQQLSTLRTRGLKTGNGSKSMRYLEQENYYNIINGYKDIFLKRDNQGNIIQPESYIPNAHIDEIFELFTFDRELRNILIKYLLIFESHLKSSIAYRFSESHKETTAYLSMNNFNTNPQKTRIVLKQIATLSNIISNKVDNRSYNSVKHYIDNHNGVPLWVLVNYLTIGNMSYFYQIMTDYDREKVTKDFNNKFNREHNFSQLLILNPDDLDGVIKKINLFRNVCAHEERLYNYKTSDVAHRNIFNYFNIPSSISNKTLFSLLILLRSVICKKDSKRLHREIKHLIDDYSCKFTSVSIIDIMNEMGFPQNWESYLEAI
ncbi:MAG: Abi family protein [Streptococcaceae bacterium]|nr:Abi family protein [Streptococcaceae bacterium]